MNPGVCGCAVVWFGSMSSNISGPPLSAPILPTDVPTLVIQLQLKIRARLFKRGNGFGSWIFSIGSGFLILSSSISNLNCCNKFLVPKKHNIWLQPYTTILWRRGKITGIKYFFFIFSMNNLMIYLQGAGAANYLTAPDPDFLK